jgi:hypothetical protein
LRTYGETSWEDISTKLKRHTKKKHECKQ